MLSARGLRLRPDGRPIDLEVHAGELVGVAGLEGHGQSEFLEALWGAGAVDGEVVRHTGRARGRDPLPEARRASTTSPTSRASAASTRCSRG